MRQPFIDPVELLYMSTIKLLLAEEIKKLKDEKLTQTPHKTMFRYKVEKENDLFNC